MPIAAASATPGQPTAAFSSSIELIHSPPDLITSLARSVICIVPSGWIDARCRRCRTIVGVDAVLVLLEIASDDRRAAGLQLARALAVARQHLALIVDDPSSTPNIDRPGRDMISDLLVVAHRVPIGRRRADRADRRHLGHAPQVADVDAALAEPADRRGRRGRAADDDRVQLAERRARSSTWSIMFSQTVGTPAEWVTPSR